MQFIERYLTDVAEVVRRVDRGAVEAVVRLIVDTRSLGGTVLFHRQYQHAARRRHIQVARERSGNGDILAANAQKAPSDPAIANQAHGDKLYGVGSDRKANALRRQDDRGIDADHFPSRVHQRSAGISRI